MKGASSHQRPRDAPKPNTRFLKSIIRDTTNHNTALLEREQCRAQSSRDQRPAKRVKTERPDRWSSALNVSRARPDDPDKKARERSDKHLSGADRRTNHDVHRSKHRSEHERRQKRSRPARSRSRSRSRSPRSSRDKATKPATVLEDRNDSDPLEDLVGPLPPRRIKGRGRLAGASGIDSRFADPAYDPRADTALHEEEEADDADWTEALSALRARFKSRSLEPDRFLAAGFNATEVERLTGSARSTGVEGDISNVRWQKEGETLEWDRNKIDQDASS